ncbi:type I phosphomannose isomerase catalytic subunit [Bombilactobacillus bombi]|uniref:type I phosphomannose isomerase catalytic subunit n=1 Tax=Bombilactobacillus bombi TaxID=1303590 RepID=UPI0015E5C311|nr:type I phosphomannose isomerase catalytic subunit [Bombilactobacillus bombi]MBA1434371.1 class I mannose-6-phosphate isomerase [Bombilactobacillus bombi]
MMEPLFLKPVFQEKIWGGQKLAQDFHYKLPNTKIGECWAISAHPHGPSQVENGPYAGKYLHELWQDYPELFGNPQGQVFPLLTKILDAEASLSVQVHPDNAYAQEHEGELGKTECWYIISAEPDSYLIYGHNAQNKQQMIDMIENGDWEHFLKKLPVHAGDFIFVPSGTVHALNKGIVALETQQSSDTTYRLYDYNRVDAKTGKKRQLHLRQSEETITVPFVAPQLDIKTQKLGPNTITSYVQPPLSPYFAVWGINIHTGHLSFTHQLGKYTLYSVIKGSGTLEVDNRHYSLPLGSHFIIPAPITAWQISGENLQLIASESTEK